MKDKHEEAKKIISQVAEKDLNNLKDSITNYIKTNGTDNSIISNYALRIGNAVSTKNFDSEFLKQNVIAIVESMYDVLKTQNQAKADDLFEIALNNLLYGLGVQAGGILGAIEEIYGSESESDS